MPSRSSRTTSRMPRAVRWYAIEAPIAPPPTTTTSARSGSTSLAGRERHQQAAVGVVGREEVGGDPLGLPRARPHLQGLAEATDAPLDGEHGRISLRLESGEPERGHHVLSDDVRLPEAGQLEDPA